MTSIIGGLIACLIGVGLLLVGRTDSRGWVADAIFVLTWPIHLYRHLRGEE